MLVYYCRDKFEEHVHDSQSISTLFSVQSKPTYTQLPSIPSDSTHFNQIPRLGLPENARTTDTAESCCWILCQLSGPGPDHS